MNPYEAPSTTSSHVASRFRVSARIDFWSGVVLVVFALTTANASHALYGQQKAKGDSVSGLVPFLDTVALLAIIIGPVAMVGSRLFPPRVTHRNLLGHFTEKL